MATSSPALPHALPPSLYRFFWDIDAATFNPAEHPQYVVNRLLDKGNLEAARWTLRSFSKDLIVETLKTQRDFSPRSAQFWATYLDVSPKEITCLQPSYLKTRRAHWPY